MYFWQVEKYKNTDVHLQTGVWNKSVDSMLKEEGTKGARAARKKVHHQHLSSIQNPCDIPWNFWLVKRFPYNGLWNNHHITE